MNILIIGPFPDPITGQSIANETLYQGLKEREYKVDYINTNFYKKLTDKKLQGKFDIKKIHIVLKKSFKEIKKIWCGNYDVIYTTPGGSYLGFLRFYHYFILGFLLKKKVLVHIHNGIFRKMYDSQNYFNKKLINIILKRVSGIIVLGNSLKSMFKDLVEENKIFVCENGVQDYVIATEKEIEEKFERFNRNKKRKILYLSNLMKEKGILEVLKVSEKFNENEIEFNIAGAMEPEIKNIVKEYLKKYPTKLIYHGIVNGEKKKELLLGNDIFILPTYYSNEGQPISILEAYVTGCSVITTNQGGIQDIFRNEINGISCIARDVENIYLSIEKIKDNYSFIKNNYKYGIENFKKEFFIEKIEKII